MTAVDRRRPARVPRGNGGGGRSIGTAGPDLRPIRSRYDGLYGNPEHHAGLLDFRDDVILLHREDWSAGAQGGLGALAFHEGWAVPHLPVGYTGLVPFTTKATPFRLELMTQFSSVAMQERRIPEYGEARVGELTYAELWAKTHQSLAQAEAILTEAVGNIPSTAQGRWDMTYTEVLDVPGALGGWVAAARSALALSEEKLQRLRRKPAVTAMARDLYERVSGDVGGIAHEWGVESRLLPSPKEVVAKRLRDMAAASGGARHLARGLLEKRASGGDPFAAAELANLS